jgi:hypothetical protein
MSASMPAAQKRKFTPTIPLGSPVVPDVYMIWSGASGPSARTSSVSAGFASTSARGTAPSQLEIGGASAPVSTAKRQRSSGTWSRTASTSARQASVHSTPAQPELRSM